MKIKKAIIITTIFLLAFNFVACKKNIENTSSFDKIENTTTSNITTTEITTEQVEIKPDSIVRVFAVGDNLIHTSIYTQAKARGVNGGYDFDFTYENIEKMLDGVDLAILNQETPIANNLYEPSSYPRFNSPTDLGDKMLDLGFNAISHCNNHILDKNEDGLLATLDYWDSKNALVYGAYRNVQDEENIRIMEINGITFSFVGFMEHTNGLVLSKDATAKLTYTYDTENMKRLIKKADELSDVVIVSVHWGIEITNTTTEIQKNQAKQFVEWGTDLIIGTQPHAVQTMEYLKKPNGGQAFVAYSLGNFISAQDNNLSMIGVTLDLNVTKNAKNGEISITDVKAIPVITHYGTRFYNVTVYPYNQYTAELANSHGIKAEKEFSMDFINKILEENIPEEFLYLN